LTSDEPRLVGDLLRCGRADCLLSGGFLGREKSFGCQHTLKSPTSTKFGLHHPGGVSYQANYEEANQIDFVWDHFANAWYSSLFRVFNEMGYWGDQSIHGLEMWVRPEDSVAADSRGLKWHNLTLVQTTPLEPQASVEAKVGKNIVGCKAALSWHLEICPGCNCPQGLFAQGVELSDLPATSGTAPNCSKWFVALDSVFRGYMARLISMISAKKTACCTPPTSGIKVTDRMTRTPGLRNPITENPYKLLKTKYDDVGVSQHGFADLGKLDPFWQKPTVCNSETFNRTMPNRTMPPTPPAAAMPSRRTTLKTPGGYTDVTIKYTAELDYKCEKVSVILDGQNTVWVNAKVAKSTRDGLAKRNINNKWTYAKQESEAFQPIPQSVAANLSIKLHASKVFCVDPTITAASGATREDDSSRAISAAAFRNTWAAMGAHYFPPKLSVDSTGTVVTAGCGAGHTDATMLARLAVEKIGMGNDQKESQNLDRLTNRTRTDEWGTKVEPDLRISTCCPPASVDFVNAYGKIHMGIHYPASSDGITYPNSDGSTYPGTRVPGAIFLNPTPGMSSNQWDRAEPRGANSMPDRMCFRTLFGDTRSCTSKMTVRFWACDSCSAKNCRHGYVKTHFSHSMDEHQPNGCAPWFSMVDASMRSLMGLVREKALNDFLSKCKVQLSPPPSTFEQNVANVLNTSRQQDHT